MELRRSLKYLGLKSFTRYIWLETYRQLKMFSQNHNDNLEIEMRDFGTFAKPMKNQTDE